MGLRSGQIIGDYRLKSFIGAGGMGEVYLAEHVCHGRAAVVKILKHLDASGSSWHRFVNEARIQSGFNHPNIATFYAFYDIGRMPCIVMEFVDGLTVDQILTQRGKIPPLHAATYFYTIAKTIEYIHQQGVIHRDIKPHNIKISSKGVIKLLDFGISKASFSIALTAQGQCIGTDNYLAPEQLAGKPATVASDIWALGLLFHEMLTGQKVFEGKALGDLYAAIKNADYTPPSVWDPNIPPALEHIIARCLKKSPRRRYPNANAICQSLQAYLKNPNQQPPKWWHAILRLENINFFTAGATTLIVIICFLGLFLLIKERGKTPHSSHGVAISQHLGVSKIQPQLQSSLSFTTVDLTAMRTVRIDVHGKPALLYLHSNINQSDLPFTTPYQGGYPQGTQLHFKLVRNGYRICSGEFTVEDSIDANNYKYRMCSITETCPASGCK